MVTLLTSASATEIEERCASRHPHSVWDFFARRDCIKAETRKEREELERRAKEERARPCIADDLSRMEGLATKAEAAVNAAMQLNEAQAALASILGRQGQIVPSKDDIKERVVVNAIHTKCDSPFHFLINVRADQQGKVRWLQIWAENAPTGYRSGLHPRYSVDFEAQRIEEQLRAIRAQEELKSQVAKAALEIRQLYT